MSLQQPRFPSSLGLPGFPMTMAVPVSWHPGSCPPLAFTAFCSKLCAVKRSLAEASRWSPGLTIRGDSAVNELTKYVYIHLLGQGSLWYCCHLLPMCSALVGSFQSCDLMILSCVVLLKYAKSPDITVYVCIQTRQHQTNQKTPQPHRPQGPTGFWRAVPGDPVEGNGLDAHIYRRSLPKSLLLDGDHLDYPQLHHKQEYNRIYYSRLHHWSQIFFNQSKK